METVVKKVIHERRVLHGVVKNLTRTDFNLNEKCIGSVMENYTNPTIRINGVVYKVKE